jgi:hypothetical protein
MYLIIKYYDLRNNAFNQDASSAMLHLILFCCQKGTTVSLLLSHETRLFDETTHLEVCVPILRFTFNGDNFVSPSYSGSPMKASSRSSLNKDGNARA